MAAPRTDSDPPAAEGAPLQHSLRTRALFHLRVVSTVYIVVLLAGTHWPRLDLSGPAGASDKLMHFLGFGVLILAIRLAGWGVGFWVLFLWGAFATVFVEFTQSLLPIGRHYSIDDIVAGMVGVVVAGLLASAVRPMGGPHARSLHERWMATSWSLLARPSPCMVILVTGSLGVLVGGLLAVPFQVLVLVPWFPDSFVASLKAFDLFVLGGGGVGGIAACACYLHGHFSESRRLEECGPWEVLSQAFGWRVSWCLVPAFGLSLLLLVLFDWAGDPSFFLEDSEEGGPAVLFGRWQAVHDFMLAGTAVVFVLTALGIGLACFLWCFMVQLATIADHPAQTSAEPVGSE